MSPRFSERALRWGALVFSIALSGGAYLYFAARPPMQVLRGFEPIDAWVPPLYQVSVFPAFAWFLSISFASALSRSERIARACLIALTGILSAIRLLGFLPLSGHALFLSAILGFLAMRAGRLQRLDWPAVPLALLGLVTTAYYKFALWNDLFYGALSIGFGAALGLGCALWISQSRTAPPPPSPSAKPSSRR